MDNTSSFHASEYDEKIKICHRRIPKKGDIG